MGNLIMKELSSDGKPWKKARTKANRGYARKKNKRLQKRAEKRYAKEHRLNRKQRMQIKIRLLDLPNPISVIGAIVLLFLLFVGTGYFTNGEPNVRLKATVTDAAVVNCVGDTMLGRYEMVLGESIGYDKMFNGVEEVLKRADYTIANWSTVTLTGDVSNYEAEDRSNPLYSTVEAMEAAQNAGINVFSLANNHVMDYGSQGLSDMIEFMDSNGITYSGVGMNYEDAYTYELFEVNGLTIAFVAIDRLNVSRDVAGELTPGVYTTVHGDYNALVHQASKKADLTIVYTSWGYEDQEQITEDQEKFGHHLVDAGADIVIGSHPHVQQNAEVYKDSVIFYSIGSFVYDQNMTYNKDSAIVQITCLGEDNYSCKVIPVRIKNGRPVVTNNQFYQERINQTLSKQLDKADYYYDTDGYMIVKPRK